MYRCICVYTHIYICTYKHKCINMCLNQVLSINQPFDSSTRQTKHYLIATYKHTYRCTYMYKRMCNSRMIINMHTNKNVKNIYVNQVSLSARHLTLQTIRQNQFSVW